MQAADLLKRTPKPSEAQIRDGLAMNLCRCDTHQRIVRAVLLARGAARLGVAADDAGCRDGAVFPKFNPARRIGDQELARSAPLELTVDPKVVLK